MNKFAHDLKLALRRLRRRPSYTTIAVLTLALGVGMTTAIFSLVDASLFRPLPFNDAGRLVFLQGYAASPDGPRIRGASYAEIRDWRNQSRSFSAIEIVDATSFNLTGSGRAERVSGEFVSPGYFQTLGVKPLIGRTFSGGEDSGGGPVSEAVISESLWKQRFGGRGDILGKRIVLNDVPLTVIGVMPDAFAGVSFDARIWVPASSMWLLGAPGGPDSRGARWLVPVAKLHDGVSLATAQTELDAVAARLAERFPDTNTDRGVLAKPLRQVYLGDTRSLVWALFGAVGLLLVIACVNITNLNLALASSRRHEMLLHAALGARRRELVRIHLAEALVIALLGAALGLVIAVSAMHLLAVLAPPSFMPPYAGVALNWHSFVVCLALAMCIGGLSAIAPAVAGYRADVAEVVKGATRGSVGRRGFAMRQGFVVAEIALALTVVTAALLMMRSFRNQLEVKPGYDASGVLAFRLELPENEYTHADLAPFARNLVSRLEHIPGVRSAAIGSSLPLRDRASASLVALPDRPEHPIRVYRHQVSPGYFATLGIPLEAGQAFGDTGPDEPVTVVSEAFARRFFPGANAVGRTLQIGDGKSLRVIGVAANARYRDLTSNLAAGEDDSDFFLPFSAFPDRDFDVAVRAYVDPASLSEPARSVVAEMAPGVPVFDMAPLDRPLAAQTSQPRFGSMLLGVFSLAAALLAGVGIYGLMSFMVSERSREFAIRMATGAPARSVRALVVRRSLWLALIGVPFGVAGALAISRVMDALLFDVGGLDPWTHGTALVVLALVLMLAVWLPASRAAHIDLATSLRDE